MNDETKDNCGYSDPAALPVSGPLGGADRGPLPWLVIGLVFALHVCFALQNRQVFSYDDSWYAETSLRLLNDWARDGVPGAYRTFMNAFGGIKAPLLIVLPQPLLLLFGRHDFTFLLVNPLCLVVSSVYLALLARRLGIHRGVPLMVLMFSAMPLTVDMSRRFFVEMLMTTLTLMFVYHAIRSERLANRGHSLAAGLALGLGVLSKVTFPLCVIGVMLVLVYEGVRRPVAWRHGLTAGLAGVVGPLVAIVLAGHGPHPVRIGLGISAALLLVLAIRGTRWQLNAGGALLLAVWVPLPWYLKNGAAIINFAVSASVGELSLDYGSKQIFSLPAILQYWENNLNFGFGTFFSAAVVLVAVLLGSAWLVKPSVAQEGQDFPRPWRLLVAWVLPALMVFTFGRNRCTRFIMPLLPAAALLFGLLFDRLAHRARALAWGAGSLCGVAALAALCVLTFGGPTFRGGSGGRFTFISPELTSLSTLSKPRSPLAEIVAAAEHVCPPTATRTRLAMFLTDTMHINQNTASYEAAKAGSSFLFGLVPYSQSAETPLEALNRADVLVYQEGGSDFSGFPNRGGRMVLDELLSGRLPEWQVIPSPLVRLPDGGVIRFVERVGGAVSASGVKAELKPCLIQYGPFALVSYQLTCGPRGLRLVTCWQKLRPDDGQYAVAAHLVNRSSTYCLNIDHGPAEGPAAFARLGVGCVLVVAKEQLPGDWCQKASELEICLYDVGRQTGLPGAVLYGLEVEPGGPTRLRLPDPHSGTSSAASAPAG